MCCRSNARRVAEAFGLNDLSLDKHLALPAEGQSRIVVFRQALHALGWTEGRNVQFNLLSLILDNAICQNQGAPGAFGQRHGATYSRVPKLCTPTGGIAAREPRAATPPPCRRAA